VLFRSHETERKPVSCSIAAYGGADDSLVSRAELEAWGEYTREHFRCTQLPGNHFYFRTLPGERMLLDGIRECCEAVSRSGSASDTTVSFSSPKMSGE